MLPSPKSLKKLFPATITHSQFVEQSRHEIQKILQGKDPRLLLIMGPCSIHDPKAALEYAKKLSLLSQEVSSNFYIVMRVYFEKPRTTLGWKGLINDPLLDGSCNIKQGVQWTRELFLKLTELKIPLGTELLDPFSLPYFEDLITWGCIGARTSSSQVHRQMASGVSFPVAFKNNTDGNIEIAVQGIVAASEPQSYLALNEEGALRSFRSLGNRDCHLVLRGGDRSPNYDAASIKKAVKLLEEAKLPTRLIIDCSHDNSRRDPLKQPFVMHSVLKEMVEEMDNSFKHTVQGFIIESFLERGNQPLPKEISQLKYGVSITDACLDWKTSEALVREASHFLEERFKESRCPSPLLVAP